MNHANQLTTHLAPGHLVLDVDIGLVLEQLVEDDVEEARGPVVAEDALRRSPRHLQA